MTRTKKIQTAPSSIAEQKQPDPGPDRITFGRHVSKTMEEIQREDPGLAIWMLEGNSDGRDDMSSTVADEERAADENGQHQTPESSNRVRVKTRWQPPDQKEAPPAFRDELRRDKTISKFDAGKFFHLEEDKLYLLKRELCSSKLSAWPPESRNISNPSYLLYHVWALVRDHESAEVADEALKEFERERRRREGSERW
ncbi:hypothetical protein L207DRAFT_521314 [Hyaloscypha variabilis F]|uniref:Uncharacterized protein n=1 Tax=Hyaloscypha variabilis (strain UAMH 11265 / GT02V1 / F) TaxID=1149755 RepID=A0A2J6QRL6_HYAVF|nr:hypothetical protein L207DRAFT_521314 [Hyaloscypha variabilis F]